MRIHFGIDFDGPVYHAGGLCRAGERYLGPAGLLAWLEAQLGLGAYPERTDHLRTELYRQSLQRYVAEAGAGPLFAHLPFYAASLQADALAAASVLLDWRDELLSAGWNFDASADDTPARLRDLAAVEAIFRKKAADPGLEAPVAGAADRLEAVLGALAHRRLPLHELVLYEPEDVQPPAIRRLLAVFRGQGIPVRAVSDEPAAPADTNLGWLQRRLTHAVQGKKTPASDDASLLVLRVRRDSDAAVYLAEMLARTPAFQPLMLLPELDRTLEQAMVLRGLPAPGVLSASLARPSLQVLKLAPIFLWEPVDVFKLMEFVTLPLKPLDDGLSIEIARVLAKHPGLNSDAWHAAVLGYLERARNAGKARAQYEFWFDRRRYPLDGTAPKRDAVGIYAFLRTWALEHFSETGSRNSALLVLAEQARRIVELLEALPETRISFLELERIVRTIYEPAPWQLEPAGAGALEYVHHSGALADAPESLLWWNCVYADQGLPPDRWRRPERAWLAARGVHVQTLETGNRLRLLQGQRPVLRTAHRLVLVMPEQVDGAAQTASLLLGDLHAAFESIEPFTFSLDDAADRVRLAAWLASPEPVEETGRLLGRPRPHLIIRRPELVRPANYETPSQLEQLFYYPHQWFFHQKLDLKPASLFSVSRDQTLHGNLAHRFFEDLLREDFYEWDKNRLFAWLNDRGTALLEREGATLLLYGREPERNAFFNRIKNAAWSLINLLRTNGWEVEATEFGLDGQFAGVPIRGKADLVLRRGEERAVVDLKWSGAQRRREMIRNREDLQLVLYAYLLAPDSDEWVHTAYFILDEGKMIARNKAAFREAAAAGPDDDHRAACAEIFRKMEKTFAWRLQQLENGRLELRTARTAAELDELYADELVELLEMKMEDGRWDAYRTLVEAMH